MVCGGLISLQGSLKVDMGIRKTSDCARQTCLIAAGLEGWREVP